jgi:hypothetical protein
MRKLLIFFLLSIASKSYADGPTFTGNMNVSPGSEETYYITWGSWDMTYQSYANVSWNVTSFIPKQKLTVPQGATHFKLVSGGAAIDFATGQYIADLKESAMLPWDMNATGVINLVSNVTANSTHSLFLVFGIQFYQEFNGDMYPLLDSTSNALSMIKVSSL